MEHFWLCGACSESYLLEQVEDRTVRITPRTKRVVSATMMPYKAAHPIAS
jgi:hypothetical protein